MAWVANEVMPREPKKRSSTPPNLKKTKIHSKPKNYQNTFETYKFTEIALKSKNYRNTPKT